MLVLTRKRGQEIVIDSGIKVLTIRNGRIEFGIVAPRHIVVNRAEVEDESARIFKPVDDLIAKEADELKKADAKIDELEKKTNRLFPPAKRDDEE